MTNYLENERFLIVNKASPVWITDPCDPGIFALNFASAVPKMVYSAGVAGHYFNFGEGIKFSSGEPLRCKFSAGTDVAVFAEKQIGEMVYVYGMPIEKLIGWTPPPRKDDVDEAKLLTVWPVPRPDIKELVPLENTESHPNLRETADHFMSYLKFLQVNKVRSAKDAKKYCENTYDKNMKGVLTQCELSDRKQAAERAARGRRSEAAANSSEGGTEAGDSWKALRNAVQKAIPFYNEPFAERFAGSDGEGRFINVALDPQTGQPTAETINELHAFLEGDEFSVQYRGALDAAVADFAKGEESSEYLTAASPFGAILNPETTLTAEERAVAPPLPLSPWPFTQLPRSLPLTSPPMQPRPSPIQPHPSPMQPHPSPMQPCPSPMQPRPSPMQPRASPMEPRPSPMEPRPSPIHPPL